VTRRSWIAEQESTALAVLRSMGLAVTEAEEAIAEGRVFVGRRRVVAGSHRVAFRDELVLNAPRIAIPLPDPFILHHEDGVLAVDKPAGVSTVPDLAGAAGTLIDLAARAIGKPASFLHATSRLDREVSGVVTFATDEAARDRLAAARARSTYVRRYVALAAGDPAFEIERWTSAIAGKESASRVRVVARSSAGKGRYVVLALAPETGRTHQLRIHASQAKVPLLGDELYGGPRRLTASNGAVRALSRIALHCAAIGIDLTNLVPEGRGDCTISVASPVSPELIDLAKLLGFDPAVLLEASTCPL
jgi:23S rRNA-/tRNA-specific pseudouridylate synthase